MAHTGVNDSAGRLEWIDDDTLLVYLNYGMAVRYNVIEFSVVDGQLETRMFPITRAGWIEDPLPAIDNEVLFATWMGGVSRIYRVPVSILRKDRRSSPGVPSDVVVLKLKLIRAVPDRRGTLRAFLAELDSPDYTLLLRYRDGAEGEWRTIWESDQRDRRRIPLGLAPNGKGLLVASNEGRNEYALYEFDPESAELGAELFSRAGADVEGVAYDPSQTRLIGVRYREGKTHRYHYFGGGLGASQLALEDALQGAEIRLVSESRDGRFAIVISREPHDAGTYHLVDTIRKEVFELGRVRSGLSPDQIVPAQTFSVRVDANSEVEAFLVRPRSMASSPLLVLPDPHSIVGREILGSSQIVQYLVDGGLSVLWLEQRGVSRESGRRRRSVELAAAVDHAGGRGWVDPDRVCIAGSGYGGYLALIAAVSRPGRYRCAASFGAPTDIPLLSAAVGVTHALTSEALLAEIVASGMSHEQMMQASPVYRAEEVSARVMLVHSSSDSRVDVEHLYRMKVMLDAHGKDHEIHVLEDAGDSPGPDVVWGFVSHLRSFVLKSLAN